MRTDGMALLCIADGVAASGGGGVAAELAVTTCLDQFLAPSQLVDRFMLINELVRGKQGERREWERMATTLTLAAVEPNGKLVGAHCGDTRLCVLRGNGIKQLTQIHTEAMNYVEQGLMSREDAMHHPRRNTLTSAIGIQGKLFVQTFEFEIEPGDRILLTTDGLHNAISKVLLRDLSVSNADVEDMRSALVEVLNTTALTDNASFLLCEV